MEQIQGKVSGGFPNANRRPRYAAHEFLETQEAIRTKALNIELYGVMFAMAKDTHLKDILFNQRRRMIEGYNFLSNLFARPRRSDGAAHAAFSRV